MLEIIKDEKENILAACEWRQVNEEGEFDTNGKYIYVANLEIGKSYRNNSLIKKLIKAISDKVPNFEQGYFCRTKYNDKQKQYPRHMWLRLLKEDKK